jgi:hypothetical protein
MRDNYRGKGIENKDKNSLADENECHPHFDHQLENYEPKIKEEPKQESSNNKHPYGCHEDCDMCYECIDKYEELHTKQEVNPPQGHKCVPFCDQLNNKHIGIHRAMSLEGRSVENYNVNATARQAKSKVKKGAAKTKIQAKKVTRKAGTQLNKRRVQVVSAKNIATAN